MSPRQSHKYGTKVNLSFFSEKKKYFEGCNQFVKNNDSERKKKSSVVNSSSCLLFFYFCPFKFRETKNKMQTNNALKKIPFEPEKFHHYINTIDDLQSSIDTIGFTIYPVDENGKNNYSDKENQKEIVNQPMYLRWKWTPEESITWSRFRKEHDMLYEKYQPAGEITDAKLKQQLRQQLHQHITDFIAFEQEHQLIDRVANGRNTTVVQMETFNIRRDLFKFKTALRTITFNYEKEQPFKEDENEFIKKYISLHERGFQLAERIKKLRADIRELREKLPALMQRIPDVKEKLDKALNMVFIPTPKMKGAFSDVVSFYVPTAEENQQRADDFNQSYALLQKDVTELSSKCTDVFKEIEWTETLTDEDIGEYTEPLFKEVKKLIDELFEELSQSIDVMSLYDDHQEFLGCWSDIIMKESSKASDDWEFFVHEEIILINFYNALIHFADDKLNGEEEGEQISPSTSPADETDDLRSETLRRYESDQKLNTNSYFDVSDWHIILDHFEARRDNKSKALAMEQAQSQHSGEGTLLIREAQQLAGEHNYKKALQLIKQAEEQGPPHHPGLFYTKANIYCQLQTPDLAIPLYKKLMAEEAKELKWWRTNSTERLIEIYEKKKNYQECIRLSKLLIAEEPDNENCFNNLARLNCLSNYPEEAEILLKDFLHTHPKSAVCFLRIGHVYFETKEYDKAIERYDRAFSIDKTEYYGAIYHKGKALMELKKYDEAVICFELCVFYFKLEKDYNLGAAQCYVKLDLNEQAIRHYRRALILDPDCREAMEALMEFNKKSELAS